MRRKTTAFFAILIIVIVAILAPVTSALADTAYYVSLGADLTDDQRAAVLELMDVSEDKLDQDTMVLVTNEDEHRYLDSVIDSSVIGSKALSSCKVVQRESGYGIHVVTYNITDISEGMFVNALATAGVEDADVVVAAPFPISGTAGLLGVMQAYSKMKGTVLQADLIEAASSELITTSEISELIGDRAATEKMIALAKQVIADRDLSDESEIRDVVTEIAAKLGYSLDEDEMNMAVKLMKRFSSMDLDSSALADQMETLYTAVAQGGIDLSQFGIDQSLIDRAKEEMPGIMSGLFDWFGSAFEG